VKILDKVSRLPGLSSTKLRKTSKMANLITQKVNDLYDLFDHFISNSWIFENKKMYEFLDLMTDSEKNEFYIDPRLINWKHEI
jgi:hypothetical protein